MSKKRRRKSKKNNRAVVVAVIIVIAIVIGAIYLIKEFKNKDNPDILFENSTQSTTLPGVSNYTEPFVEPVTSDETETQTETQTETTTEIETTAPSKTPTGKHSKTINKVVAHYTDFMGAQEGTLYIRENEAVEKNGVLTLSLRMNGVSPNMLICDVYVNLKTGDVTDSMENEPWNINN